MTNEELITKFKAEIERRKCYISVTHFAEELLSFLSTLESEKPMQEGLEEEISKSIENLEGCTTKINGNPEYHLINDDDLREFARHFAEWGAEHRGSSEIQNDLEEAAGEYADKHGFRVPYDGSDKFYDDVDVKASKEGFIAGAKWQADHTPLPEDTVLFNKGVAEGRRLESEENKDRDIVFWRGIQYAKEQMLKDGLDAVKTLDFNKAEKTIAGVFVKYGMDRQKEQMMKEAIHYVVQDDLDSHGASYNIPFIRIGIAALKPKGIGVGDKVRIIIVKDGEK